MLEWCCNKLYCRRRLRGRLLDAQIMRGEGKMPRHEELYQMTQVYQQRRKDLVKHYKVVLVL